MDKIKLGLVGVGKIARDQHLPALSQEVDFQLVATASLVGVVDGVESYDSVESLVAARPDVKAISLCTPPSGRFQQAMTAISMGRHVMLEKPPAATVSQAEALAAVARSKGVSLFATWHSREGAEVDAARKWLADKTIHAVRIKWKEDIRRWHPGQEWILSPGGFGVFDPAINALSIATCILPDPLVVLSANLAIPENCASPISANMLMGCGTALVNADFDFLQTGEQSWDIEVDTDAGMLKLSEGGGLLELPNTVPMQRTNVEYRRLYAAFANLIRTEASNIDLRPLQLVADAFLTGRRTTAPAFHF